MISFLVTWTCIFAYCMIGGVVGRRTQKSLERRKTGDGFDRATVGFLAGAFWPLSLPAAFGTVIGDRDKATRDRARAARELDQARHSRLLEEENLREARAITQRLRALGREDALKTPGSD